MVGLAPPTLELAAAERVQAGRERGVGPGVGGAVVPLFSLMASDVYYEQLEESLRSYVAGDCFENARHLSFAKSVTEDPPPSV